MYKQYCEQVDMITRQVIQYHTQLLNTSLLHDAESHDFEGNKEFYEVSFLVGYFT